MATRKTKSIIRKGPSSDRGSKDFINIKADETVTVIPVLPTEEIMSIDVHGFWEINPAVVFACLDGTGEECPGCALDNEAGYRAFLPVLDHEGELKVFPFGIGVERKLVMFEDELGDITGLKFRVKRTGSGLKTKYDVINTGQKEKIDVDDDEALAFVESKIEVKSYDKIIEELTEAGLMGGKKKSKRVVEEDEDEEDEPVKKVRASSGGKTARGVDKGKKVMTKGKKVAVKKGKDEDEEWEE